MTKSCKNVLSNLRKLSNNTEDVLAFLGGTTCICLASNESATYDYSKYANEIYSVIRQLVKAGYLDYSHNEYYFTLTQQGLHPYRFAWDTLKLFLLKSILVPIVVSVITTLITLSIQSLLSQM